MNPEANRMKGFGVSRKSASIVVAVIVATALSALPGRSATTFSSTVVTGSAGYEPGIKVSPAGTLFVNEPNGGPTGGHNFWRLGTEAGAKWTKAVYPDPSSFYLGGFDSDAATGHDGSVYVFDLEAASNAIYRSQDDGKTWNWTSPVTTIPSDDRAWIMVGPKTASGETVYTTWTDLATSGVNFARSEDSGVTWLTQTIAPSLVGVSGDTGKPVADLESGFVGIPYFDGSNGGLSMLISVVYDSNVWDRAMQNVVKVGDTLYTTWIDSEDFSVKYSTSTDNGLTWLATPKTIAPAGSDVYPWLSVRGSKVAIAWYSAHLTAAKDPNAVPSTTNWFVDYSESLDGGATFSAAVATSATRSLHGTICTQGISCDTSGLSAQRALGDFLSITIDPTGHSVIAAGSHGGSGKQGLLILTQTS
jgi:hypothetical protein